MKWNSPLLYEHRKNQTNAQCVFTSIVVVFADWMRRPHLFSKNFSTCFAMYVQLKFYRRKFKIQNQLALPIFAHEMLLRGKYYSQECFPFARRLLLLCVAAVKCQNLTDRLVSHSESVHSVLWNESGEKSFQSANGVEYENAGYVENKTNRFVFLQLGKFMQWKQQQCLIEFDKCYLFFLLIFVCGDFNIENSYVFFFLENWFRFPKKSHKLYKTLFSRCLGIIWNWKWVQKMD